jgi:hypothetical protein
MFMRWLNTIMAVCIIAASLPAVAASDENISCLKDLLSSFEDQGMNSQDLAFFLATHNYNAVPLGSRVKVSLDGAVYMLIPNGDRPGLSDLML